MYTALGKMTFLLYNKFNVHLIRYTVYNLTIGTPNSLPVYTYTYPKIWKTDFKRKQTFESNEQVHKTGNNRAQLFKTNNVIS